MLVRYRITFETEYHIGNGFARPGIVDNTIIRDNKGRLYIPGHTIKGIIRDAAEELLAHWRTKLNICNGTFDPGKKLCGVNFNLNSPCLFCRLFGSVYTSSYFNYSPAVFEKEFEAFLGCDLGEDFVSPGEYLIPDQVRTSTHNKISRASGRVENDHLFSYELGASTTPFEGMIEPVNHEREVEEVELVVLISALRFIKRIGGRRRKGWGKCEVEIVEPPDWEKRVNNLKELLENGKIGANDKS
jgi:CRISPR/Cas system CSM-associated protein Csm3 (group 7 of RAMP superfamily)